MTAIMRQIDMIEKRRKLSRLVLAKVAKPTSQQRQRR
jgi:hypothetical protein